MTELEEGIMRVIAGPEKKSRVCPRRSASSPPTTSSDTRSSVTCCPNSDPVHKVSIISRGQALGYTISLPTEDKFLTTRAELNDTMAMTLGGRAAEEIVFSEITTGASNDLEKVTETAKQMVMRFGMSERLGPRVFGHDRSMPFLGREFSPSPTTPTRSPARSTTRSAAMVEEAHQTAQGHPPEHREALDHDLQDPARAGDDRGRGVPRLLDGSPRGRGLRDEAAATRLPDEPEAAAGEVGQPRGATPDAESAPGPCGRPARCAPRPLQRS